MRDVAADPLLRVEGIDVYYGHVQALRGVSLEIYPGELVALVGANGAGKTTTLRAISGLLKPVIGSVTLDGQRIDRMAPERVVAMGVSHLPEGRGIFPSLTVFENLQMGFYTKRSDRGAFKRGVEQMVELFPRLGERLQQAAGTMSGGEQQMLALARALLPGPRLLMIDELSLGLAPVIVQMLFERLKAINEGGTTVLLVEQYVNLALQVADRAYVLEKGGVALSGSAEDLARDSEIVRSSYLGGHGSTPGAPQGVPAAVPPQRVQAEPAEPERDESAERFLRAVETQRTPDTNQVKPPAKKATTKKAPAAKKKPAPKRAPAAKNKAVTKKAATKKEPAAKKRATKPAKES